MEKNRICAPFWALYSLLLLPFLAGGFHSYIAILTTAVFAFDLIRQFIHKNDLKILINLNSVMVLIIVIGYSVTPLWAADKGMAPFGILRYTPLLLLTILQMQNTADEKTQMLSLLPLSGVIMTIIGCVFWFIPNLKEYVAVNGRLSGFLQYPNTFSAFLLIGVAIQGAKENRHRMDWVLDSMLIAGILLSGSRTGVILLILLFIMIAVFRKIIQPITAIAIVSILAVLCITLLRTDEQITFLGRDLGSLFIRILYYKDALPVILQHPFGLGYLGYRALETTFQTSRYTVSFVHNGLLQMLLDIGWIPSLLFVIAVIKTLVSPKTNAAAKMVLTVLSAHAIIDFDLQFFLFWVILLLCLDFERGKIYQLYLPRAAGVILTICVMMVSIWLGSGDYLYQTGKHDAALNITPFHTDALSVELMATADPGELDHLSDKILSLNPTHALAYSAKANAAYTRGQIPEMIQYKEKAIQLTPYTTEEYCDYIEKLYTVLQIYVNHADTESAAYCMKKLLSVPDMMAATAAKTDPLAYKTGNNSELILPEPYQDLIVELEIRNPDFKTKD